jgi:hypothetical protein
MDHDEVNDDKVRKTLDSMGEIFGISRIDLKDGLNMLSSSVLVAKEGLLFFAWDHKTAA